MDEEGNVIEQSYIESDLEEVPFEDKCMSVFTNVNDQQIWAINQQASRALRKYLASELKSFNSRLDSVDIDDFYYKLEREATRFEDAFCELYSQKDIPVFNFRPKYE